MFIKFTDEKLKPKVQNEDEFIYIISSSERPHFNLVWALLKIVFKILDLEILNTILEPPAQKKPVPTN